MPSKLPSGTTLTEVVLNKLTEETSLGLTLAPVAGEEPRVIITAMTATIANTSAEAAGFGKGCIIYDVSVGESVAPEPANDYWAVSKMLKEATGKIKLRFYMASLPEGWTEHLDDRERVFYRNKRASLVSSSHPLSLDLDAV